MKESARFGSLLALVLMALVVAAGVQAQSSGAEHASSAGLAHGMGVAPAAAPAENLNDSEDGGSTEDCGDIDPSEPCYSSGGTGEPVVMTCNAIGGLEMCWTCHPNRFGKIVCARANYSAQCKCDNVQVEGAGPGITYCSASGKCKYI